MGTYIIFFSVTLFLSYCCKLALRSNNNNYNLVNKKNILGNMFFFFSCAPLIILAGLRYNVGTDYIIYKRLQIPEVLSGITDRVEILYRWIIIMGDELGNLQWIFIITHILIIFFSFKGFYDLSRNYFWSVFIFIFSGFFNNSLNIMRQAIAISIFLFALQYVLKRRPYKYFGLILIAILFHKTALLYLPVYFLFRFKFHRNISFVIIVSSFFLSGVIRSIMEWISYTLNIYTSYFSKYSNQNFGNTNNTFLTICITLFILSYLLDKNISNDNRKEWDLYNNLLILTTVITTNSSIIPNNYRIIYMVFISVCYLIPMYFTVKMNKISKILISTFLILIFLIMFFRFIIEGNMGETLPYRTIFNQN